MPPPQRAKPARKSARCGVGDASPRPHPPHPQPVGSGPWPHARTDERSGVGERPTPDAPNPGKRAPPRAPSCRPHSTQSQLARARAVGLVTGPHTRTPRTHSQWLVGPGRTPERTRGRGWERAPDPGCPTPRQETPPPGTLMPPPQRVKPARKRARTVRRVTGPHARTPRTHSQWVVGPGRTPERTRGRGWESAHPRTPHTQVRGAPPGRPCAAPQRAKPARKSARCGVGDGSPCPHPPHPQPVGSGPRPHARKDKWSGVGEHPTPDAPHPGRRRPPRAPSCRPQSVQSQLARERALCDG